MRIFAVRETETEVNRSIEKELSCLPFSDEATISPAYRDSMAGAEESETAVTNVIVRTADTSVGQSNGTGVWLDLAKRTGIS